MARTTTQHTIVVETAKPHGVTRLEAVGSATIYPGMLLTFLSGGKITPHATASGASAKFVALENQTPDTFTYPTTAAIDIPYASEDTVYYAQLQAGDVANMRWANGQSPTFGIDWVISDGNGNLTSCGTGVSVGTSNVIGLAWQTVTASGVTRGLVRVV